MSLLELFDTILRTYALVEVKSARGDMRNYYVPVGDDPTAANARIAPPDHGLSLRESGERGTANALIYMDMTAAAERTHVYEVLSGPDASSDPARPLRYRALSVTRPRSPITGIGHTEIEAELYERPLELLPMS